MKKLLPLFTAMFLSLTALAQTGEFTIHPNGLIYSDTTMGQLRRIVDSMNLRFKQCAPWKKYYSMRQGLADWVVVRGGGADDAEDDVKSGMKWNQFRQKYQTAVIKKNQWVVQQSYASGNGRQSDWVPTTISGFDFTNYSEQIIWLRDSNLMNGNTAGKWAYHYSPGNNADQEAQFEAWYFPGNLSEPLLAEPYAALIRYADCMIDTATSVFFADAERDNWMDPGGGKPRPATPVADALNFFLSKARSSRNDKHGFPAAVASNDTLPGFTALLDSALAESMALRISNSCLERLAENFGRPAAALHLKRSHIVVGTCSEDYAPREHARDIAILAAESISWDVFLRAHLDIMNDQFQRVTDNRYAAGERGTYIRELEELGLNVDDLLLGISLRIANPSGKHYYADISRMGRALTEYRDRARMEKRMAAMISDPQLDLFNRIQIYFLYDNYRYYLAQKLQPYATDPVLAAAVRTLPSSIIAQIDAAEAARQKER